MTRTRDPGAHGSGPASDAPLPSALTALTQAPLGVAVFDREMRYLAASSRFLTDQGLPADTPLVGRVHYDVVPEVPERWRELHRRALAGEELSHPADPFRRPDGRLDWIRWSLTPWRHADGRIGGLVLYVETVTEAVESRHALEAAEARYRAVFNHAALGVARVSPSGRLLEVNDGFCAITRRGRNELLSLTFQEITHPHDVPLSLGEARGLLAGDLDTCAFEKRYLAPGGETVWAHLTCSLVRTASGEPDYFVVVAEDITFRKQAEAEEQLHQEQLRLMINELNHRVKNTLATVQSMAAQTLRSDEDREVAYRAFEARLMGLSEVHDVLTREHWSGAQLHDVVRRALRPFGEGVGDHIGTDGPDVWLLPGAALSLALVLHELATNAVKYGALSVPHGRVDLRWTFEPASGELRLVWSERGGPPVAPPTRRGFGSRLIERGLRAEGGRTAMAFEPAGVVCTMEVRLPPSEP